MLTRFVVTILALVFSTGVLMADGSFKSERAGAGLVAVELAGYTASILLVPYRSNRTYYRLTIAKGGQ